MNVNVKPSDRATLLGVINPQSASSVQTTGWVLVEQFAAFLATVIVGSLGSSATVDAKIQQASASDGTGTKDVSGTSITQLTQAGTDANKQVEINVRPEQLDEANGFKYIRLSITPATAACLIAGTLRGFDARNQPATDATTVDEVVGG